MNIGNPCAVVILNELDLPYVYRRIATLESQRPVTISALLLCVQSFGIALSADEFPEVIKQLTEKEMARPALVLEGTFDVPLPNGLPSISTALSGVLAGDGRYTITESTQWGSTRYWYDSDATYIGKDKVLEVDTPEARVPMAVFLGWMLTPATSTLSKLLQEANAIETVVEQEATAELSGRYEYLLRRQEESPDIRLVLTLRADGGIAELRISEVNGYPMESVYTFGHYASPDDAILVPQEYEHRLEPASDASKVSGPTILMRIKLTKVSPAPADAAYTPDRAEFSDVHDYRTGLRRAQRATEAWLDGVKDYLGF